VRAIKKDLPAIFSELKELGQMMDEERKHRDEKHENLDNLNKQIDRVQEKRKKIFDEIEKFKKQKEELKDKYYGQMIDYTKYQFLVNDIKWMNEVQQKLRERDEEKKRREQERLERIERIKKEKEERLQRELEKKQREEERRQREIERKKREEEEARSNEINHLSKLNDALNDNTVGNNPLFDHIETCEFLKRYCQKQIKNAQGTEEN
jgi:chromosome segregation ATPase